MQIDMYIPIKSPTETEFNEILLDYLEMQGRSSSDEDASDEDDSSSGNDSDIGHAISAKIVGDKGVEPPSPADCRYQQCSGSGSGRGVDDHWANA